MLRIALCAFAVLTLTACATAEKPPTAPANTTYNQPALLEYDQVSADRVPSLARTFVKINFRGNIGAGDKPMYFDEEGNKHYLDVNHWSGDVYFWTTINGQQHQFHLKPDGTFPTIAEGLESNRREAERLKAVLPLITPKTLEQCFEQARNTLLDPTSFRVTAQPQYIGNLETDAFEGLLFEGKIVARNGMGNIAPGLISCGYNFVDGKVVFENFSVGNNL